MLRPVTVVVSEEAVVIVAVTGPLTCVHAPAPTVAAFALIVTAAVLVQTDWSLPALAVVGRS